MRAKIVDEEVLAFVGAYITEHGYPPSRRDIADSMGCSLNGAHAAVIRLIEAGLLQTQPGLARSLNITGAGMKTLTEDF